MTVGTKSREAEIYTSGKRAFCFLVKEKEDKTMKRLAVIPARSGSKGLKDKNIRSLCGKPLLAYSIEAARASSLFDTIYVSTDSEKYAIIAKEHGAQVPFLRPESLAGDAASSWDVVKQALAAFEAEGRSFDEIALLQPTSPLRTAEDIRKAHGLLCEKEALAVIGVCPVEHSPLWSNTLPEDGDMRGFLRPEALQRPRQELPAYYRINGAMYFIKKECLEHLDKLYENKCFAYVMPQERSIDIDSALDFYLAEALLRHKGTAQDETV